jgi:hypothetical protein
MEVEDPQAETKVADEVRSAIVSVPNEAGQLGANTLRVAVL